MDWFWNGFLLTMGIGVGAFVLWVAWLFFGTLVEEVFIPQLEKWYASVKREVDEKQKRNGE